MNPNLSPAQLKPGDVLIREQDHLGRPDHRVTIVKRCAPRGSIWFQLKGYWRADESAKSLCGQGYKYVERDGARLAQTYFTKYW